MDESPPRTTRRRLLQGAAATGLLYGGVTAGAAQDQEPVDDVFDGASDATGEATMATAYPPTIAEILSPLAMNPAVHEGGETLRVELDADVEVADPTVTVRPTFGNVRPETELANARVVEEETTSDIWLDTRPTVTVVEADLPAVASAKGGPTLRPGLYDVTVAWGEREASAGSRDVAGGPTADGAAGGLEDPLADGAVDTQPRSLSLWDSFPEEPRIYVLSDAHAGDPRALRSGAESSLEEGDPGPFLFRYENVLGVGTDTERWGGFRRAVAEVSALDPDVVVFPGDFAFGQDAPKKYYQEYADAYAMIGAIRAPVYSAVGNHDGYIQGTTDGKQIYHNVIGPWYWSRELREDFRLTSIDTYDWAATDREGVSYGVSAWGGQVREEQLERLRSVLESWREDHPDATHVSFSHHCPAWRQDPGNPAHDATEDTPVVEQAARGVGDAAIHGTDGQAWRGEGRTEVVALLSDVGTALHVNGHVHNDRLSRVVDGDVVYTPVGSTDLGRYDHATSEDRTDEFSQRHLETQLLDGDGTLYVDATTAGSETAQYWGWRAFDVAADGVDPGAFGYRPDEPAAFLEERAVDPSLWAPEHAAYGRYSHPTFEFDVDRLETGGPGVALEVRNDLESDRTGTLLLTLAFEGPVRATNCRVVWRRAGEGEQDVLVAYDVDAASTETLRLEPAGPT